MTLTEYIAAGANRHPSAADWTSTENGHGLLAFGSGRNIAFWRPEVRESRFHFLVMFIWN
jgi:elongator complex protein 2